MKKIVIDRNILRELGGSGSIFKRSDITFFPAQSSEEIIELHDINRADLIIADALLPTMGCVKLCSQIRSDGELKYVSIIIVCDDTEGLASQCKDAGANVVMRKPVNNGELLWKASELLVVPRRKDMRVLLRGSVKGSEGDKTFFALSHDISISGMRLETDRELKLGDQVTCSFNLGHSEITVACRVERADDSALKGRRRYGVSFMNCDTKTLVIIEYFVKGQPRR